MTRSIDSRRKSPKGAEGAGSPERKRDQPIAASGRAFAQILTVKELAAHLRVHPNTIYRYAKRGQIPCFRVGDEWRFNLEVIERWLQGQKDPWKQ